MPKTTVILRILVLVVFLEQFEQAAITKKQKTIQTYRTYICEHFTAVLMCPKNLVLNVLTADYGRWDTVTCPNLDNLSANKNVNCRSGATTQAVVSKECHGKSSCSLPSWFKFMNNGVDPCGGTWKYANMTHQCVAPKAKG